jgi:hypothetical protein
MVSFDEPVENAWMRSHAQCECQRASHHQGDRCTHDLVWEHRGRESHQGTWEAHRKTPAVIAGWEAVKQVEILCWECYQEVARAAIPSQRKTRDRIASRVERCGAARSTPERVSGRSVLDSHRGSA